MALNFMEPLDRFEGIKTRLALHILDNVVPKIINDGTFIGDRIAVAYTWYRFLCRKSPSMCPDIEKDPDKWSLEDLKKIADKLVDFATQLLIPALRER